MYPFIKTWNGADNKWQTLLPNVERLLFNVFLN